MTYLKALVVEDEPALQLFYKYILEKCGYQVLLAGNGQEAIQQLTQHTPHLIFLDMLLPGLNGEAVLDYISSQPDLEQVHIIVASSASGYARAVERLNHVEFWLKPIRPAQVQRVADYLRSQCAS